MKQQAKSHHAETTGVVAASEQHCVAAAGEEDVVLVAQVAETVAEAIIRVLERELVVVKVELVWEVVAVSEHVEDRVCVGRQVAVV